MPGRRRLLLAGACVLAACSGGIDGAIDDPANDATDAPATAARRTDGAVEAVVAPSAPPPSTAASASLPPGTDRTTNPTTEDPATTDTETTDPEATDTETTDPATTDTETTDPATTDTETTDPATTDTETTDPATTDTVTADPTTADDGSSRSPAAAASGGTGRPAPGPVWFDLDRPRTTLGHSVEGRPIVAERVGPPGGRPVVVIGVIHGDEDDGVGVIEELRAGPPVDGVELWLVESMNPDGQTAGTRGNANGVDLNRNFPHNWGPIGEPGDSQFAGAGPASEPETQSIVNLLTVLRPDITIWYHQDLFTISPSTGREGRVRARYAELTGLPQERITGGRYTGVAATWARQELAPDGGVAFIVELGETLPAHRAVVHAAAVRTVAREG